MYKLFKYKYKYKYKSNTLLKEMIRIVYFFYKQMH